MRTERQTDTMNLTLIIEIDIVGQLLSFKTIIIIKYKPLKCNNENKSRHTNQNHTATYRNYE